MTGFVFESLPGRVVFGLGALDQLSSEVDRLGARRALVLATLKANAPVTLDLDACAYRGTTEAGRKLLKEKVGFSSFAEKLPRAD